MRASYSDFFDDLVASDLHSRIKTGASGGKLYEVMIGERQYSYVTDSFYKNMLIFNQNPRLIMRHFHWLVGEGLISSSDVEASIHKILNERPIFRLGMEYISEYLENYRFDDWFPQHWLELDCHRLISNISTDVKINFTEDEKFYLSHFNKQHPELSVEF